MNCDHKTFSAIPCNYIIACFCLSCCLFVTLSLSVWPLSLFHYTYQQYAFGIFADTAWAKQHYCKVILCSMVYCGILHGNTGLLSLFNLRYDSQYRLTYDGCSFLCLFFQLLCYYFFKHSLLFKFPTFFPSVFLNFVYLSFSFCLSI